MNQCDGCRRGMPLSMGVHLGVGWDTIGCTAHLYKESNLKTCQRCHADVEELAADARCSKCTNYNMYEKIEKVEVKIEGDLIVDNPEILIQPDLVVEEAVEEPEPEVKPKRKRRKKKVEEEEGE